MPITNILYTSHVSEMQLGGQFSLYNLVKKLDRTIYRPILLCPSEGSLSHNFQKIGCDITYHSFPHIRFLNTWTIFKSFTKTFVLLKKLRVHIIHSDHPTDTFYLAFCSKLLRIPLIWHARVSFKSRLDSINTKLATKVIGVSNAVSFRFQTGKRISSKYVTIYNGVDTEKFKPDKNENLRNELMIDSDDRVITTIGQIKAEKGIFDFVAAVKLIQDRNPNCKFLVAGDGDENEVARLKSKIIEQSLQKYVHYLGFRDDIARILNATDVFVLASFRHVEGLPRVVIEAMSCEKPVVGTDVHGINEAIENGVTGLLVPPREPQKLARAIMIMLENENESRKMGIAGRKRVKKLFSIKKNVSKISKIYRNHNFLNRRAR